MADPVRAYTKEDIARWRATFRFPLQQHSLAKAGYTDDELVEWRKSFDQIACGAEELISFTNFQELVRLRYGDALSEEAIKGKVTEFWTLFDADRSNSIDFGEFMKAGLYFDVDHAKEEIRLHGPEAVFQRYAAHGLMSESELFDLMADFNFLCITTTDMRKVLRAMDTDRDGLLSLSDFLAWADGADSGSGLELPRAGARDSWERAPDDEDDEVPMSAFEPRPRAS